MTNHTVSGRSKQVGIIISSSLAGFMVLLDGIIVNISLPDIASYFNISTATVVQIALVYLLMLSSTLIIFGKLAETIGVKRIFISGFVVFTLSSLLCGLAPTFSLLLGARLLQALGGSMLFATSISLITRFIPAERRGWAFGIFSPVTSLGLLIGSPLGGLITGMLDWHWIFLVNVPVGILAVVFASKAIPTDIPKQGNQLIVKQFDFLGSALSFTGLALLVFFISKGRDFGWTSLVTLGGLAVSGLLILGFVFWEKRSKDPILDLSIFNNKSFSFAILASVVGFGLMAGSNVLLPFYLMYGLKIDVSHAGFILMTFAVVFSMCSPITGRLSDRVSKVRLTNIGMVLAATSCIAFALLLPQLHLGILFGFMVLLGVSYALFITPNNNLVMSLAPQDKQSISSSVFKLGTNLGQMFGLILMQLIFTIRLPHNPGNGGFALKSVPVCEMMAGFSWAYIGGAAMCVAAILFSLFIREDEAKVAEVAETAFLG
ncbi:MAG: MFS transporter [Bacteroidales bacterium]|nr:MFS transporter [Bacteroidales bacterium]